KVKTAGQEVFQMEYNGKYTRREIQKIGDALSKELEKEGTTGALQVTLKYPTGHYRVARKSEIGEKVILYANEDYYDVDNEADQRLMQEPGHFASFRIYVYKDIK